MKRLFFIFVIVILITGCGKKLKDNEDNLLTKEVFTKEEIIIPTYIDNNPISVGIYKNRVLIKDYYANVINDKDIAVFNTVFTNDETLSNERFVNLFNNYKSKYQDIDSYRIGYILDYSLTSGEVIHHQILNPDDWIIETKNPKMNSFYYFQIYMYDDLYHANDSWYSHVEQKDFNENTFLTSIKLTASWNTELVIFPIKLTAFTYDNDDFDTLGNYRGNSSYTINIYKN